MHVRRASRRIAAFALPAFAGAVLAAGVITSAPATAARPTPAPRVDVPAPEAGTCWNYTYKQASLKTYTGTRTWYLWYTPTAKQWKDGAHWGSCAAASVPPDEKRHGKLIAVRGSIAGTPGLSRPITFNTSYGRGTYTLRKPMTALADEAWPGSDGLQKKAAGFCEKELGHRKFFWYGPSETEWVAGYTTVRCYSLKKA